MFKIESPFLKTVNGEESNITTLSKNQFIRRIFINLSIALGITGITSYLCSMSPIIISMLAGGWIWGLFALVIIMTIGLPFLIDKLSYSSLIAFVGVYSVVHGVMLTGLFLTYTIESLASTLFIASGMFLGASLFGSITKKDLSSWRSYLIMALIGLLIVMIVNIFLKLTMLGLLISIAGVILFTALTAYTMQEMVKFSGTDIDEDSKNKISILFVVNMYLNFLNLFLFLMDLFGQRK